jgi:hypothetical protein
MKATKDCGTFTVICELDAISTVDGGPESGEWLEAQTWKSDSYILSLGTDDGVCLNSRADKNIIPRRFVTSSPDGLQWVSYTRNGLALEIPSLLSGETLEVRFSASWKNAPAASDLSTWFAVDLAIHG